MTREEDLNKPPRLVRQGNFVVDLDGIDTLAIFTDSEKDFPCQLTMKSGHMHLLSVKCAEEIYKQWRVYRGC